MWEDICALCGAVNKYTTMLNNKILYWQSYKVKKQQPIVMVFLAGIPNSLWAHFIRQADIYFKLPSNFNYNYFILIEESFVWTERELQHPANPDAAPEQSLQDARDSISEKLKTGSRTSHNQARDSFWEAKVFGEFCTDLVFTWFAIIPSVGSPSFCVTWFAFWNNDTRTSFNLAVLVDIIIKYCCYSFSTVSIIRLSVYLYP